jgi:hypothetical protein
LTAEKKVTKKGEIKKLQDLYKRIMNQEEKLEELDLIGGFFTPLRAEINQGRYDYELVKVWHSATNLLDLKVQTLLNSALQKNGLQRWDPSDSGDETLSSSVFLSKAVQPLARPILLKDITKAYIELMIHRKKKRAYSSEPEMMGYDPQEIEPISIEVDKNKLLEKIMTLKESSIDLRSLLKEKTWEEVIAILNILLHLAHERKIKLHQINFPNGKIVISYVGNEN